MILPWIAAVALLLSLLPIVNWIPGGHLASWYAAVAQGWVNGGVIVAGGAVVLAISAPRVPGLWHEGLLDPVGARWKLSPRVLTAAIAVAAALLYIVTALVVFGGRPLHIDELAQMMQAGIFADGALFRPTPSHPEFFSQMHMVDAGGKTYAHFPPGGPALLALGMAIGVSWLIVPLCAVGATLAFRAFVARAEARPTVALGATLIFAFAPFMVFMAGTHMNHVPSLMFVLIGAASLARVGMATTGMPGVALVAGLSFGAAATVRPVDGLAFALPAAAWLLILAARDRRRWGDVAAAGIGVLVPVAALLGFNAVTTGAPLRFGYEVLWGKEFGLGFHDAPWGAPHTPVRGLELVNLAFLRLGTYFLETPVPAVLPAIGALALARSLPASDRYLLASSGLLVALHFAYWHDGFYVGPRFMLPLVPVLALWTARFLPALRERFGAGFTHRWATYGCIIALGIAALSLIPTRAKQYAGGMATMRWDADGEAEAAGVRGALVFVRESWGSQLLARLWALEIPRASAQRLYEFVDACALEEGVSTVERRAARGAQALAMLRPLMRDSARVVPSTVSPDATERMLPGAHYGPLCSQRVLEDRAGFTSLVPLLLARGGGNIYARDLQRRNLVLLLEHPDRPVYLLRPPDSELGTPPRFTRLSRDSLLASWGSEAP
jgi:hypothetical protein